MSTIVESSAAMDANSAENIYVPIDSSHDTMGTNNSVEHDPILTTNASEISVHEDLRVDSSHNAVRTGSNVEHGPNLTTNASEIYVHEDSRSDSSHDAVGMHSNLDMNGGLVHSAIARENDHHANARNSCVENIPQVNHSDEHKSPIQENENSIKAALSESDVEMMDCLNVSGDDSNDEVLLHIFTSRVIMILCAFTLTILLIPQMDKNSCCVCKINENDGESMLCDGCDYGILA